MHNVIRRNFLYKPNSFQMSCQGKKTIISVYTCEVLRKNHLLISYNCVLIAFIPIH